MKKSDVMAKAERLRKKESEKLASAIKTAEHNAPAHNEPGEEFVSRLYWSGRTYLVRVPRSAVLSLGLKPCDIVRLKILREG